MEQPGLSIVIPCRNDPLIGFTVRRIHESVKGPYEIIVVDDGSDRRSYFDGVDATLIRNTRPVGVDFSADRGIRAARYDVVLKLDAHMNFPDDDWASQITDYVKSSPGDICSTRCPQLAEDRLEMASASGCYYGAHILPRAEPVAMGVFENNRTLQREYRRILPNRWNDDAALRTRVDAGEAMPIGCILGAAYAFSRQRYLHELQTPWHAMRGWGSGEQTLSLANYLRGGNSVILPVSIGHVFRSNRSGAPYSTDVADMIFNNIRLAHLLMEGEALRLEVEWILAPWQGSRVESAALKRLANSGWSTYREYLRRGPRTWQDYLEEWIS